MHLKQLLIIQCYYDNNVLNIMSLAIQSKNTVSKNINTQNEQMFKIEIFVKVIDQYLYVCK